MRIDPSLIKSLDLAKTAEQQIGRRQDRLPPLIVDRCLANDAELLAKHTASTYTAGSRVPSETITMPRKGFGPRPVVVTSPSARILYSSLVDAIVDALPPPTRGSDNWDKHKRFGLAGEHDHVVELDIASCYEYIDHKVLRDELVLRSMNLKVCEALDAYLKDLMGQSRGLPQMQGTSDRLADAYLSILDRQLARQGYPSSRYADDIRVVAATWETANTIIEQTAEWARALGLVLSSEKTAIYRTSTLIDQDRDDAKFFDKYFYEARDALTQLIVTGGHYEDEEVVEIAPEDKVAAQQATWLIFNEWWDLVKKEGTDARPSGPLIRFLTTGLNALVDYEQRVPDALLKELVFHYPARIEQVSRYIINRSLKDNFIFEDTSKAIDNLVSMGRQSPWSKLWLLHTIETALVWPPFDANSHVSKWIANQLNDRHEIVRAQAAWLCAVLGLLTSDQLSRIYTNSSTMTQPALAAAARRQEGIMPAIMAGIVADSPLNRAASQWAATQT